MSFSSRRAAKHIARAQTLLKNSDTEQLIIELPRMTGLTFEVARPLATSGWHWAVAENIASFDSSAHRHIASQLAKAGSEPALALVANLEDFVELNHIMVAGDLLDHGNGSVLLALLDNFDQLNVGSRSKIINTLIEQGRGDFIELIKKNLERLDVTRIDLGKRGSGTETTALLFRNARMHSHYPEDPEMVVEEELLIDFGGCERIFGTPQKAIQTMRDNVSGPILHPKYANAPAAKRDKWAADINEAADTLEFQVAVLAL